MKEGLKITRANIKKEYFGKYREVKIPSHMLDSIWFDKNTGFIKIIFATGQILEVQQN